MVLSAHQLHYLPWLRYFHKIAKSDIFVILDNIQFNKGGFQNRNKIKTKKGWIYLTVPVLAKFGDTLDKVLIDNKNRWKEIHLNSIITNYSPAKYFKNYIDFFKDIYKRPWERLNDINYEMLLYFLQELNIKTKIVKSHDLNLKGEGTERLVNICKELNTSVYLTGDYAAGIYLEVELFKKNNIKVIYQEWKGITYNQLFEDIGFIGDLSIIDLLFNEGENSLGVLLGER